MITGTDSTAAAKASGTKLESAPIPSAPSCIPIDASAAAAVEIIPPAPLNSAHAMPPTAKNGRIFETYAESARHSRQTAVQQPAAAGNDESYKKRRHYRRSETEHAVLAHRPYKAEYPGEQRRLIVNGESLFAVAEHRKGNAQRSRRAYREQQRKRIVIQHSVAEEADRAARYRSCNG